MNLVLSDGSAADLSEEIEQGRLHAAFLRAPVTQSPKIAYLQLLTEEMLLIVPVDHPLVRERTAAAMPQLPLSAVAAEPLILVRRPGAPGMYSNLLEACQRAGFTPRIAAEVERMLPAISFVAAGLGVSAVPASMRGVLGDQVAYCRMLGVDPMLAAPLMLAYRVDEIAPTAANLLRIAAELELDSQLAADS